jgi:prevent-host-death family protein
MHTWPVQDAKARFSELLETSLAEGPQVVTKHGKAAAVLVPIRQWEALQVSGKRTLKQLMLDRTVIANLSVPPRGGLKLRKV